MSTLATPFTLPATGQVVPNRTLKSAMSETLGTATGAPTDALVELYGRWARGGIGLSVTGNVMVDFGARGEPGNVVVEDDRDLPMLRKWAEAGKLGGGLIYAQLNHPGRQVPRFLNPEAVAPSAVPFKGVLAQSMATARALTSDEIEALVARFARTAAVFEQAGFDGIQIHGAHGYLVSQFLSPHTNRRDDAWGGDLERRRRFLIEIVRACKASTSPGFGIGLKLNSADFKRGGITEEETQGTVKALDGEGLAFMEVSGGTYEAPAMVSPRQSTREREAYFLEFARTVRASLSTPLVVTGGFRSGPAMNAALDEGAVDLVGLARPLALYPDLPNRLVEDPSYAVDMPPAKTGIAFVDRLGMTELLHYELQLHRMGDGKDPKPRSHPLRSLAKYAWRNGLKGFKRRRA
ncbi:MAG: NADH:flavin oxidoreductase/NADH oxidase family protein [Deltaproteobacteria bacterium]|nr:MAG: NADH:flavin oxidoreductase/NADH oxidase family protein [Deltaproteobacteria bacterium]